MMNRIIRSGINAEFIEIDDSENVRRGIYESLALSAPPRVVKHGGWTYEEVDRIFKNRRPGTCLIAVTDAENVGESDVQMLYRDAWAARADEGIDLKDFSITETPVAAKEILKTSPRRYLERISQENFDLPDDKIIVGDVLGYIVPEGSCQDILWGGGCPKRSENCAKGNYGYVYHIWSTVRGIGSVLGFEATKNLIENGADIVSEHSRAEGHSQNLFDKLGYVKKGKIDGFLPGGGDAVPMCITKERYEEMKPKYAELGLI